MFEYLTSYTDSRGNSVRRSACHKDMWIIEYRDGGFSSINTSQDIITVMHTPTKHFRGTNTRPVTRAEYEARLSF